MVISASGCIIIYRICGVSFDTKFVVIKKNSLKLFKKGYNYFFFLLVIWC